MRETKRSNRQRLRTIQIRRFCAESLRCAQLPLVCRAPHLLRAIARHRFQRSMLSVE